MDFPFLAVYSNDHVDVGVDKEKEEARSLRAPLGNQIKWMESSRGRECVTVEKGRESICIVRGTHWAIPIRC